MLRSWTGAVADLAEFDPSHAHRMSVAGSLDEEDAAAAAPGQEGQGGLGQGGLERQPAPAL